MNRCKVKNRISFLLVVVMSAFIFSINANVRLSHENNIAHSEESNIEGNNSNELFVPGISIVVNGNPLDGLEGNPGCNLVLYEITVTNTGDDNLENIVINEDLFDNNLVGPTESINADNILEVDEVWTYSFAHVVTVQEKIDEQIETLTTVIANVVGQPDQVVNDNDSTIIILPSCPSSTDIAVVKSGVALDDLESGPGCNLILYQFSVSNEGGNVLENVVLNDPLLGGDLGAPDGGDDNNNNLLEVDEIWTYTIPYITTIQDKFEEEVVNQATVAANIEGDLNSTVIDLSDDNSVLENDPTITVLPSCPSKMEIALVKTGIALEDIEAGPGCNFILYEFTVTNEGTNILENVVLNDPLLGGDIAGPISGDDNNDGFLDLDEAWIYSAVYNTTQEDFINGFFENQATVIANLQGLPNEITIDLSDDNSVLEDDPTIIDLTQCQPRIALIKTSSINIPNYLPCSPIRYEFSITNESPSGVALENITLTDPFFVGFNDNLVDLTQAPLIGDDNDNDLLEVGETWSYVWLKFIGLEEINAGEVINQATVEADVVGSPGITVSDLSDDNSIDEDDPTVTLLVDCDAPPTPIIGLIKEGELVDIDADGCIESILYTFTVTNTGNVDLEGIVLKDIPLLGDIEIAGPIQGTDIGNDGILSVAETWTYQALYGITQVDIDTGVVINQAEVFAFPLESDVPVSDLSDDDNLFEDTPTRTEVPDDACPNGSADIGLIKEGELVDIDADGCIDSILYTFTITNNGDVDLEEITLEDELLGGNVPGPVQGTDVGNDGILSVGETWTYQALYGITQEDIDNTVVVNQAQVTGFPLGSNASVSDLSDDDSLFEDTPTRTEVPDDACTNGSADIGLIKEGELVDIDADGCIDSILYTFTITNNGDVDLEEITLEDELLGGNVPGPVQGTDVGNDGILSVGETWTYQALYGITQEDIDIGFVVNQAQVTGFPLGSDASVSDLSDDDSLFQDNPLRTEVPDDACPDGSASIGLLKTGELADVDADGCIDSIRYTFTVTNNGDVDLEEIFLEDELLGGEIPGPVQGTDVGNDGILSVGETWTYQVLYGITQEDIDIGFVVNQAQVTGFPLGSNASVSDLSDDDSFFEDNPLRTEVPDDACPDGSASIGLLKTGELVDVNADGCIDSIRYTFTVTNNGDVDLEEIFLEDELLGGEVPGPLSGTDVDNDGILSVGETWTYQALYELTQEDVDIGLVVNTAQVAGFPIGFNASVSDLSDDDSFFEDNPLRTEVPDDACGNGDGDPLFGIAVIKTGKSLDINNDGCDDSIRYDFSIVNGGSLNLENIVLIDELLGGVVNGLVITPDSQDSVLQPGEEWQVTAIYNVTQEDIDGVFVENQATITAKIVGFDGLVFDFSDNDNYQEDDPTIVDVTGFCADGGGDFEIFNGITPNGDGFNDYFQIVGIENYPNNNVKIFNRWGVKVYETDNYGQGNNLFRGISEGRNTIAEERELPSGTYFYTLTFPAENPGEESYNGYLYINRD